MRGLSILAALSSVVIVLLCFPSFSSYLMIPPEGGQELTELDTDVQGVVSNHSPKGYSNRIPATLKFVGDEGDYGHVAWGIFGIPTDYGEVSSIRVDLTLNEIGLENDGPNNRIGIATSWLVNGTYHYLEFDVWDSPATSVMPIFNLVNYDLDSDMPTVIIQRDQLSEGERGIYEIDIQEQYERFWPDSNAELFGVYIVVEKTSSNSIFYADLTLHSVSFYQEMI
jgi:hypothetical protein